MGITACTALCELGFARDSGSCCPYNPSNSTGPDLRVLPRMPALNPSEQAPQSPYGYLLALRFLMSLVA